MRTDDRAEDEKFWNERGRAILSEEDRRVSFLAAVTGLPLFDAFDADDMRERQRRLKLLDDSVIEMRRELPGLLWLIAVFISAAIAGVGGVVVAIAMLIARHRG